jgi:uncharacterized damage-inducible protein DinB
MDLTDQLKEAWKINNKAMLLLADNLNSEALNATLSTRGGRTTGMQLAHTIDVRITWLEIIQKKLAKELKKIPREEAHKKELLKKGFIETGKAMEDFIDLSIEQGGKVKSFKTGLIPFIAYLISHESHHRAHLMLTLKQCGIKLDDKVKWGIWEWGK